MDVFAANTLNGSALGGSVLADSAFAWSAWAASAVAWSATVWFNRSNQLGGAWSAELAHPRAGADGVLADADCGSLGDGLAGACSLGVQAGRPWSPGVHGDCGGRVSQSATVSSTRVDAWLKAGWRCPNGGLATGGAVIGGVVIDGVVIDGAATVGAAADVPAAFAAATAAAASNAAVAGPFGRIFG